MTPSVPRHTPVLIAGGGPAGLACAIELGRRGVACLLVEPRRAASFERPRAKTTSVRTMEHFRRWGLAERIREVAPLPVAWSDEAVFCTALLGQEITRIGDCFGLARRRRPEFAEAGQQIPQPLVEQVLREVVAELEAVTVLTGFSVIEAAERPEGVDVVLAGAGGELARVSAEHVLGCEGSRSVVREAIGARYQGSSDDLPNFNVVFRAPGLAERVPFGPAIHYWVVDAGAPGLLGRMDLGDTWWAIAIGVDAATGSADPAALVRALIGADAEVEVLATDPWTARMLVADRFQSARVALVGDAAHLNPPWGGHGFNTAVGDAVNVGWKLAATLAGWGGPRLMASYEAERRPVAIETIAVAQANMAAGPGLFADPDVARADARGDAARGRAAARIHAGKTAEFHSLGLVLGSAYDGSPIVAAEPGEPPVSEPERYVPSARAGARLPHRWLPDGRSLYDVLGEGFSLLLIDAHADASAFVAAAKRAGLPLAVVDARGLGLDAEAGGASLLLVRPDQHVAWRGGARTDAGAVLDHARGA